jgi:predicted DNA-binding transcriptional regulator YafY
LPISTVLAAYFGASLGQLFDETVYGDGMRRAAQIVRDVSGRAERFEQADRQFVFVKRGGEIGFPDKENILNEMVTILLDSHEARLRYRAGNGKIATALVHPLSIAIYDHQLYVIARRRDGSFHPFRFARIEQVTRLNRRVPYPTRDEYDPEQVFRDSIGVYVDKRLPVKHVTLRLKPVWARYTKTHRWHPSQDPLCGPKRDELHLRVRVCPELIRWVLGFGADAVVLKPASLRKRVIATALRMARSYRTPME